MVCSFFPGMPQPPGRLRGNAGTEEFGASCMPLRSARRAGGTSLVSGWDFLGVPAWRWWREGAPPPAGRLSRATPQEAVLVQLVVKRHAADPQLGGGPATVVAVLGQGLVDPHEFRLGLDLHQRGSGRQQARLARF